MQEWRLINCGEQDGAWNMAMDEALLHSVENGESPSILRLYRWKPATVTLGYFQQGSGVVNLSACRDFGYSVVRRFTGGRAVLHDHEVTYAVISPEQNEIFPGGVSHNYHVIAEVLQATLAEFGLQTTISSGRKERPATDTVQRSACFTAPALSELVINGQKMTGSAQKRLSSAFLQHGSIPLDIDPERLYMALNTGDKTDIKRRVERLADRAGWMNRWLDKPAVIGEVEQCLVEQFKRIIAVDFSPSEPTIKELQLAKSLLEQKYANPEWTLRGIVQD
jgi:lipoate-protein ligase A